MFLVGMGEFCWSGQKFVEDWSEFVGEDKRKKHSIQTENGLIFYLTEIVKMVCI